MATGIVLGAAAVGAAMGGATAAAAGAAIMSGIAIGWSIGAMAGSMLMASDGADGQDVEGPRLQDLSVQTSTYGAPIPIVYGSMRVAGNVIWSSGIKEHKHEQTSSTGGKGGGGGSSTTTTYTYTCSLAIGICEGVIVGINKIWMDGKLFQDSNQEGYNSGAIQTGKVASLSIYTGTENQEPDPTIESIEGENNVPGYRGTAYVVFEDLELADYGNRIPNIEFEVAVGLQSENLTMDMPVNVSQFTVVGSGDLMVIQHNNFLQYYKIAAGQAVKIYENESFYSTAMDKEGDQTLIIQDSYNNDIIWLSIPDGEQQNIWKYGDTLDDSSIARLQGIAYGYVEGYGVVYILLPNPNMMPNNESQFRIYNTNLAWQDTWFELKDKNGDNITLEAIVVYDGKIIANTFDQQILNVYSINSIPYPEKTIEFNHQIEAFDIYNGNLLACDGHTVHFYVGISNTRMQNYSYSQSDTGSQSLDVIVSNIMNRINLEPSEYNTSELSDISLIGFSITKVMTAKNALKPLMQAYQFDVVEAEGQIKFLTRGKSLERTFSEEDLAAHEQGGDMLPAVTTTRIQENELPTKVVVGYQDQNADYQVASQFAKRVTQDYFNKKNIRLPIVMTASEAVQIAEKLLATTWAERNSHSISVLSENLDLVPGSVINAAGYRMIIGQMSIKTPGLIEIEGPSEEPSSYQSDSVAVSPEITDQFIPGTTSISFSIFMNLPSLQKVYSKPGFFVAPYSFGDESNWPGATVYITNDNGDTWFEGDTVTSQTLIANINSSPGNGPVTRWDMYNTLTITPINYRTDLLKSASSLSVLSGTNTAAIGTENSGWEIISYQDVIDNEDGTFTLSGFIRGRRGTENMIDVEKKIFVFLQQDGLAFVPVNLDRLGITNDYKVISIGDSLYTKTIKKWSNEGDVIKPWSPVHIEGVRNSSGDLTITWLRRSRSDESWKQGEVPLLESSEKYEVDILDNSGNVVRTLSTSGEDSDQSGVIYTSSQQNDDFGSSQNSVDIKVYQISDAVERGFPGEATI